MGATKLADVEAQIQKFWSPLFTKELRESTLLAGMVNKDYEGDLKKKGDTVKVSQILAPKGKLRNVGDNADVFSTEPLVTKQIEIKADKRATAAFEFEDLVEIQSQIGNEQSEIRDSMRFSIDKQINDYLYSLVDPIAANKITGADPLLAADLIKARKQAGREKWLKNKPWWALHDPDYYGDLLDSQTLTSSDFVNDRPVVEGEVPNRRYGFNHLEDNSRDPKEALLFHPDFLHLVMQTEARFKVSDLHSNKQFGFVISVDIVFGAKLGIDGRNLHITIRP